MMNYEEFMGKVTEEFMSYMPEKYKDMELRVDKVHKTNRILDGMHIVDDPDGMHQVSPTIYINDMYDKYMQCADFEAILNECAESMVAAYGEINKVGPIDFESAKDNIVFQLINTEQNKELLEMIPNRPYMDLSIIYRLLVKMDEDGMQSAVITNKLAEHLGFTEEQLMKLAVENTKRIFPPVVKTMEDVARELLPPGIADLMIDCIPKENLMWIISNERRINGAISMLYEDKLHKLALQLNDDLYILPSSTHEVIAVRASMGDPYEYAGMVAEINLTQVNLDERLSNQVYRYDKDLRKLTLATDTPNKRLDGAEADSE